MKFFSEVNLPTSVYKLDYSSKILLLGSCFSTHIYDQLTYYQFQAKANPFGVLFHPKAILKSIEFALGHRKDFELIEHDGIYHSFLAHSSLSASTQKELIFNLEASAEVLRQAVHNSNLIFISLGTAWFYSRQINSAFVANCHKIPSKQFTKQLSTVGDLKEELRALTGLIKSVNTSCNLVFTVSPVKHLKDGLVENSRSKAHLIAALHEFIDESEHDLMYFPSFELLVDELRDYRFYNADLAHPSSSAIKFIWEKFKSVYINQSTLEIMNQVEVVQKGLHHKAFNPQSEAHQKFMANLEVKISKLKQRFPHMNFINN
ncbi:GSCFA domain-containing protein [Psychroflexus sp. ALD_RP9]|uniref:GSCFA domain-containing protein n=1 Tax=Psychroflexus sp. ALD_RP9 TaxID=2777186 RepID=UPI001A8F5876|nr:GSCFA domain-containing protein [Psychroflexus sp. ALD_RP9]QSS97671.1 GSCFA domain-containing protein [Psychroflexus sp. ALD_RP9]